MNFRYVNSNQERGDVGEDSNKVQLVKRSFFCRNEIVSINVQLGLPYKY